MNCDHNHHSDTARQKILDNIEKYGCHLVLIEPDNLPGFVYSIGLYQQFNHPEIICFGLKTELMGALINDVCDRIKQGETFTTFQPYPHFLEGYDIQFIPVDKAYYRNYVGYGRWFYKRSFDFPLLQLVWPDKDHNFPWDSNVNPNWKFKQPLLDRNTDFKFYEERNLCVFTSKQAFSGDPILHVYHDENGDWQFHTSLEPQFEDGVVVCLEEITKLDPSINDTYHLPYGWRAWRDDQNSDWQYEKYNEE